MSLVQEWPVLEEHVLPLVSSVELPRLWAPEISDAIAMAVAANHGPGGPKEVHAYAPRPPRGPGQVRFTRSDLRPLPTDVRSAAFRKDDDGCVPSEEIARQVILTSRSPSVDLLAAGRPDDLRPGPASPLARVRLGGFVLVTGGEDPDPDNASPDCLVTVGDSGRVFRKVAGPTIPESTPAGTDEAGEDAEINLAQLQRSYELASRYINLARSLARRFAGHGEPRQDLDQVAFLGLLLAAQRFDETREISFSTFATTTVLGELKRYFRDKTWMMKVPRRIQETYLAVKDAREALSHELGASPTIAQIGARLAISEEDVLEAMEAGQNYWPESLDVSVFEDESSREVPVHDPAFGVVLERHQLLSVIHRLSRREQLLLKRLYFDGHSQREVAEEIGVSQMQVSRLLARTIQNIRAWAS
jgi:RNA polymerase sigma-B factor